MIRYCLDPGKHETSCAVGYQQTLLHISRLKADSSHDWDLPRHSDNGPVRIILEVPVSYPGSSGKANDLIAEVVQGSIIAGRIAQATGGTIHIVHPSTTTEAGRKGWKGQVPKPLHHRRILQVLTPAELAIVIDIKKDVVAYVDAACERYTITRKVSGYKALVHNDLDAIGMFLEDCGRLGPTNLRKF